MAKEDDDTGRDDDTHDDDDTDDDEGRFDQAQVSRIATRASKKASKAERDKIADELGMSPAEAAKVLKELRERDDETATEAERKLAAATDREQKAIEREAAAARRELNLQVREALRDEGVSGKAAKRIVPMLGLEVDADEDDIADAIDALRDDLPQLFDDESTDTDRDRDRGRNGRRAPGSVTRRRKGEKNAPPASSWEAGRELARQRFGDKTNATQ